MRTLSRILSYSPKGEVYQLVGKKLYFISKYLLLNWLKGRAEIAKILIAHGLDASDRHNDGYTPIHRACWGREARHTETGF